MNLSRTEISRRSHGNEFSWPTASWTILMANRFLEDTGRYRVKMRILIREKHFTLEKKRTWLTAAINLLTAKTTQE